ncbi:MAG: hypothetical protein M3326_08320 [Actinomycetota bacterium]|nr:hypothetical protein [Actinomycetota bacterium]
MKPVNLAARLNRAAVGNPASATLASGVANCFPGLEFDHRNLDRRFFPGLVIEFADPPLERESLGGLVLAVDLDDPLLSELGDDAGDLPERLRALRDQMAGDRRRWWLGRVSQAGVTIDPRQLAGAVLDGTATWRVARSLEPGPVTVVLRRFPEQEGQEVEEVVLDGRRRSYVGEGDTIDGGYAAGELTQSLCSPWQHDFRDCGCYYWASNHPDIAIDQNAGPRDASRYAGRGWVDWLRARPERPAFPRFAYYEISHRYQDLAVVVKHRESAEPYRPAVVERARPYRTVEELVAVLRGELAPLEHVLILEYLYAWSSVRRPEDVAALDDDQLAEVLPFRFRADPADPLGGLPDAGSARDYLRSRLRRDVIFLREELRATAISEMRHLALVNELLRRLAGMGMGPPYEPALGVATEVFRPTPEDPDATRPRALRPLTVDAVDDFVAVERPSGGLEGRYARVRATLRQRKYRGKELFDVATRIVEDGVDHFAVFSRMRAIVDVYDQSPPAHLRPSFIPGSPEHALVARAARAHQRVVALLAAGYAGDGAQVDEGRRTMLQLEQLVDDCANEGLGVPFFS